MKVDLERSFGRLRQPLSAEAPTIYLLHGFRSKPATMTQLEGFLRNALPLATIILHSYDWKQSVLRSGAQLAHSVLAKTAKDRGLFFVGHSMGGLVCRVANVILNDPVGFAARIPWLMPFNYNDDINFLKRFDFSNYSSCKVNGIVTLATPNSGAMLQGQVTGLLAAAQLGAGFFSSLRHQSVLDLTTDKLFRLLQGFAVSTPILSISGSVANRFATGSGQIGKILTRAGLNLTLPHDTVVEDVSVDLTKSILPNECVNHGASSYVHLRAYEDCTDINHFSIHKNQVVADYVIDFVARC